jgi:hypothetical protein
MTTGMTVAEVARRYGTGSRAASTKRHLTTIVCGPTRA